MLLRAGAAAVLVTGTLIATVATPAFAAVTSSVSTGSFEINPGETKNVTITLTNSDGQPDTVKVGVSVNNGNLSVKGVAATGVTGCDSGGATAECAAVVVPGNGTKDVSFQVSAKSPGNIPAGSSQQAEVSVTSPSAQGNSKVTITAKGPAAQTAPASQTVTEVSGTVTDSTTGKGVKGATVVLEDGAGKSRQATTNDAGSYRFLGTETSPIAPGNMQLSVTTNGYDAASKDIGGQAGKANTKVNIPVVPIGSTATPVAPPADEASTPAGADSQSAAPGANNTTNASNDSGSGLSSYILIALGALLVIFGIVAIVLLLRRRGDDDDEELEEEPAPRRGGGGGQRPGYRQPQADPTMVGAMGGSPTMINRGAANDATAIVRPGRANDYDVPPDPYGAPLPRAGSGYGAASAGAGYGAANGGGYNDQAGFAQGAPSAGAGYGPSSRPAVDPYGPDYGAGGGNGYGDQAGGYSAAGGAQGGGAYADSTQRWEPEAGNGYAGGQNNGGQNNGGGYNGGGANGYGAESGQNGYGGGQGGYNGGGGGNGYGADQGGYQGGGAGGYGPQAGQGGYGGGAGDGYPSAGDGYPSAGGGGYGPSAGNGYNGGQGGNGGQGDYDGPYAGRGGYEQRGGYEPAAGGQRGGYEPAAGYERDGYERVPEPPRAGNGYEGGNNNYEQRGGYGEPQGGSRGQAGNNRRSLDWLDD
ncbi:carboxypeptidase regulatory-like domain-containing protein [Dactylosporangium siamense]|uniref:carboxypeptidase regulatory-like domain-containing protein n=1 Tax=Dactylosporangium siamense TaxID=685454 RepID=UPI0031EFE605